MFNTLSRTAAALALVVGGAVTTVVGVATPAMAVDCSVAHQDRSPGQNYAASGAPVRTGPHESCALVWTGPGSIDVDCWTKNTAGNIWWFVHVTGDTSTKGWLFIDNFYPGGGIPVNTPGTRCLS
jgi:hypothetical protein